MDFRRNPLFQVMFTLQDARESILRLPGLEITRMPHETVTSKFDLTLHVAEASGELAAGFEYDTDLFDAPTIRRMAQHFLRLLEAIVADPERRVGELPLLSAAERRQLEVEWNDTASDYARDRSIPELFEKQAALRPESVALVDGETLLTYRELNVRANRLAHHLRPRPRGRTRCTDRRRLGALVRHGRRHAGHPEGGRGVCSARS